MTIGDLIEDVLDKNTSQYFGDIEKQVGAISTTLQQNPALGNMLSKPTGEITNSLQSLRAYLQAQAQQKQQSDIEAKKSEQEKQRADAQKSRIMSSTPGTRRDLPNQKTKGPLGTKPSTPSIGNIPVQS
jgi:chromosome condensin MukBEF ATPase and DNA-binding subunit MukB